MKVERYQPAFRYVHSGLIVFGISSFLTGELAEENEIFGFWSHSILGLLLCVFIIVRITYGLSGSEQLGFGHWINKIAEYRRTVFEDIKVLLGISLPERGLHEGIAGLVQAFGLLVFSWMGLTGLILLIIEVTPLSVVEELFEEMHEVGEYLIPVFLLLHIGAVILHYIEGDNLLRKINPFI